ncbi:MAG: hypothetical protein J7K31_01940, partial [Candidatus Aenigmarchaeota archaeon]|nr:hypothetical protein [Candidatus Aenigmarchaeota archaeon]
MTRRDKWKIFSIFIVMLLMISPFVEAINISQNFGQKKTDEGYMSLEDLAEEMLSMEDGKIMEFMNQPKLICTRYGTKESNNSYANLYRFVCLLTSKKPVKITFSLGNKDTDFLGFVASDPDSIKMKNNLNDKVVLLASPNQNYTYRTVFSLMFSTEAKEPKLEFNAKKAKNIYVKNPDEFEQFLGAVHFYETIFLYKKRYEERTGHEAHFNFGFANLTGENEIVDILNALSQEEIRSLLNKPVYFQVDDEKYKIWSLGDKIKVEKNGRPVGSATLVMYISPGAPIVEAPAYSEITPKTPTGAFLYNPSVESLTQSTLEVKEGEKLKEDIQEPEANRVTGLFLKEKLGAILEWFKNIFAPKEKEIDLHEPKLVSLSIYPTSVVQWHKLPPSVLYELESKMKYYSEHPKEIPINKELDLGEGYSIKFLTESEIEEVGPTGYIWFWHRKNKIPTFVQINGPIDLTFYEPRIEIQLSYPVLKNLGLTEKEAYEIIGTKDYVRIPIHPNTGKITIGKHAFSLDDLIFDKNKITIS